MGISRTLLGIRNLIFYGLSILGGVLIYVGFGGRGKLEPSGEPNEYFVLIGIILILPKIVRYLRFKMLFEKIIDAESKRIRGLIKNGDKIIIDLNKIEIFTNSYKQEIEVGSGYNTRLENIDVNHNVLLIKVIYKNKPIKYRFDIDMEKTKLKMRLAIQKFTEFYIDPKKTDSNYLDMQFLLK